MYYSKAAAIPKRNTCGKLNHRTANVTAYAYDYELIAFNIIIVYVIMLNYSHYCFVLGAAGFEAGWPGSKPVGLLRNGLEVANRAVTYIHLAMNKQPDQEGCYILNKL